MYRRGNQLNLSTNWKSRIVYVISYPNLLKYVPHTEKQKWEKERGGGYSSWGGRSFKDREKERLLKIIKSPPER